MADFKCIPLFIDAATGKQIDEFGSVVNDRSYFRLLYDETVVLCCQFYDIDWSDGEAQFTPHAIDPSLTLEAFGDSDFDPLTPFMFLSSQTQDAENTVNIEGDWIGGATADPLQGRLSFRVNTNTVCFAEAVESVSGHKNFYFCITGVPAGQTEKTVLAYFKFKAENRPTSSLGEPESADPDYLTAQEVRALVKSAPVREFSVDGATDWHSIQTGVDRYYREQRNGGEWSTAVTLVEGPQGIQGEQGIQGDKGDTGATGATNISITTPVIWDENFEAFAYQLSDVDSYVRFSIVKTMSALKLGVVSANPTYTGNVVIFPTTGRTALTQAGWTASTGVSGAYYRDGYIVAGITFVTEDDTLIENAASVAALAAGQWAVGDEDSIGSNRLYVYPTAGNDPTADGDGFYQYDTVSSQTVAVGATPAEITITASFTGYKCLELWRDTFDANDTLDNGGVVVGMNILDGAEYSK
jgi:hypothetical protein